METATRESTPRETPREFVTWREFAEAERKMNERIGEVREQLRDIRALLIAMLCVSAPNLVNGLLSLLGKH